MSESMDFVLITSLVSVNKRPWHANFLINQKQIQYSIILAQSALRAKGPNKASAYLFFLKGNKKVSSTIN